MAYIETTCVLLTCDDCDDPWSDNDGGVPHFPTRDEALRYATGAGWAVVGESMRCYTCARDADCATTGHQYGPWQDGTQAQVPIPYRSRWCEHCNESEFDPPFRELSLLMHAERQMQGDGRDA